MAVFEGLQQIAALWGGLNSEPPIIQDQHLDLGDSLEHAGMAPVALCDGQCLEEARDTMIGDGATVTAGFVAKRASDPAFAEASRAGDQEVLVAADPASVDQMGQDGTINAARAAQIEVLNTGGLASEMIDDVGAAA